MTQADSTKLLWELEQRRRIEETLMDYSFFVDRNDPIELVNRVFCEDGCFELGSKHAVVGREQLALMFAKTLAQFTRTSHHLSNVRVSFDGDETADSSAYVYAWHVDASDGRRIDLWGRPAVRVSRTIAQPEPSTLAEGDAQIILGGAALRCRG